MTKTTLRRAIALVLCLAGIVLMVVGGVNMPRKSADAGINLLNDLRAKALMNAAGDGIVESYVAIAKKQAHSSMFKCVAYRTASPLRTDKTVSFSSI